MGSTFTMCHKSFICRYLGVVNVGVTTFTKSGEIMNIAFNNQLFTFQPWRPQTGRVFGRAYAFDSETTPIDQDRPWITPAYVIGAAFGGARGFFITREHAAAFFATHRDVPVAMHNTPFDLAVIHTLAPDLDVYGMVDHNRVWDTQLLHRLYLLGTEGHTASNKGESTLEHCTTLYLGADLPKDVTDSNGNSVRTSYGQWLNRPPNEIEPIYLEYLAKDAIATFNVCTVLHNRLRQQLESSRHVWGFVSPAWLQQQIRAWGYQTHHIQLRAAIVLKEITANGLHLDMTRREELVATLQQLVDGKRKALAAYGYLPGAGSAKALQSIFMRLQRDLPQVYFPRTDTKQFSTSHDAIFDLADTVPFVKELLEYREIEKLLNSFLGKMAKSVLHPSFNGLARTGRTTSFGEINAQNLPTDERVRSCFIPSPGHVFIDADYSTIELATLAQACMSQFQLDSHMADAINAGQDLHRLVAARVTGKAENEVTKEERKNAKPINFGKPGGMSNATLKLYAKTSYGVDLDDAEVEALSAAWFELFPEMREFLGDGTDLGMEVATLLQLTPASHHEHTGDDRFANHPANAGRLDLPHPILGSMALKVFKQANPTTWDRIPYNAADVDYFWVRLDAHRDLLPPQLRTAVANRQPSPQLQKAVMSLVGRSGVFTLTSRLRANATYCARHNTVFQGLAADGAKLAMWKLWRAGYRIVNFIHDQFLIEVPANSDLKSHADTIQQLMITGMKQVVPDLKVGVSYAATDRWRKAAEAVIDTTGTRLLLWQPPQQAAMKPPVTQVPTATPRSHGGQRASVAKAA